MRRFLPLLILLVFTATVHGQTRPSSATKQTRRKGPSQTRGKSRKKKKKKPAKPKPPPPPPKMPYSEDEWVMALDAKEHELTRMDINAEDIVFDLFKDYEGVSILFKIKAWETKCDGSRNLRKVGVFKTKTGTTNPHGEIFTYRLGRLLGVHIYPVSVPNSLDARGMKKLIKLLSKKKYYDKQKDARRKRVIRQLKSNITKKNSYEGVLKEWVPAIKYIYSNKFEGMKKRYRLKHYLSCRGLMPPQALLVMRERQRLYQRGLFIGKTNHYRFVRDFSNMMVIDTIAGNHDRFPGANIHMQSVLGAIKKTSKQRYDMGVVRLHSLDNGATLRFRGTSRDLFKYVSRFDRDVFEKLLGVHHQMLKQPKRMRASFGLDEREYAMAVENMTRVIKHIRQATKKCKNGWF